MKKRILFVLPSFTFGGTVFSTLNMISLLDNDKYDINVFAMTHEGPVSEYYKGYNVLPEIPELSLLFGHLDKEKDTLRRVRASFIKLTDRLCTKLGKDYKLHLYRKYAKKLQNKGFDFVASCQEGYSTKFVSCFTGVKKIAWFRSEYSIFKEQLSEYERGLQSTIYHTFDKIVCVSRITRDDFVHYFPDLDSRTFAIHNIQNTKEIESKGNKPVSDSFDDSVFSIVSVGRIAPQKQFHKIPEIAAHLKEAGCSFRWYIIGDGNSGGENDKLQSNIAKYNVGEEVVCMGSRLNPYPYIKSAKLCVNTSYYEACPRVVIESKILHTPVICADFSSAKEFVTSGVDGYVDKLENLHTIIAKLINDNTLYRSIKDNCDKYVFNSQEIAEQLNELFS